MSKEIKELVLKIFDKAIDVSNSTKTYIKIEYCGVKQYFEARIYTDSKLTWHYYTFFDLDKALEDLNRMYSEICKYEKEKV